MFFDRFQVGFPHWNTDDLEPGQLVTIVTTGFSGTATIVRVLGSDTGSPQLEIRPRDCWDYDGVPVIDDLYFITPFSVKSAWVKPRSYREARDMTR